MRSSDRGRVARSCDADHHDRATLLRTGARRDRGEGRLTATRGIISTRVLRLRPGARILVFDGRGVAMSRRRSRPSRSPRRRRASSSGGRRAPSRASAMTLAQAVLKGEKMDAVVRDATMMGVRAIQPVITRADGRARSGASSDRHRPRAGIASRSRRAKQCGRAVVPDIAPPSTARRAPRRHARGLSLHAGRAVGARRTPSGASPPAAPAASHRARRARGRLDRGGSRAGDRRRLAAVVARPA